MKPNPSAPHPRESGWLPDFVFTGGRFEAGLAFFADALGRLTRFSREPADLAVARKLPGQVALPGLVNGHSHWLQRIMRGRSDRGGRAGQAAPSPWPETLLHAADAMGPEDVYDAARMAFMEMLLSGIACVGEFHGLHHRPDGSPWDDPNRLAHEVLRAARDTGVRLAFFKVAALRAGFGQPAGSAPPRFRTANVDRYVAAMEGLREIVARDFHRDDTWLGVALATLGAVPRDELKPLAAYAHAQRMRLHIPLSERESENEACRAEYGRTPVALLAEQGLVDKRFTAVHGTHLTDDDIRLLADGRAALCACPTSIRARGDGITPADRLLAAGIPLSLGTDGQTQINLFEDARLLEFQLRAGRPAASALGPDVAGALLAAATVAGARSLGAPSGALEVGRPADFFTVNRFDPSIAGAGADALLSSIVFSLERRAIREVWIGGRQHVSHGRHAQQGAIVGRFVEMQDRLWARGAGSP